MKRWILFSSQQSAPFFLRSSTCNANPIRFYTPDDDPCMQRKYNRENIWCLQQIKRTLNKSAVQVRLNFYYRERKWSNFTTANKKIIKTNESLIFTSIHATLYSTPEIADFDCSWTPRMVPFLLVIQYFIDVQESQTSLIQPITTTNQDFHGKLCSQTSTPCMLNISPI